MLDNALKKRGPARKILPRPRRKRRLPVSPRKRRRLPELRKKAGMTKSAVGRGTGKGWPKRRKRRMSLAALFLKEGCDCGSIPLFRAAIGVLNSIGVKLPALPSPVKAALRLVWGGKRVYKRGVVSKKGERPLPKLRLGAVDKENVKKFAKLRLFKLF